MTKLKTISSIIKLKSRKTAKKIKELKNDDRVEKYAREKYYMKRDNEDIYIIEFEDEKKAAAEKKQLVTIKHIIRG